MSESKQPHEQIYRSRKSIFFNNLLGGIGWSIGASVGFALFVALLSFIASNINFVPIVGTFVAQVNTFVAEHSLHLNK